MSYTRMILNEDGEPMGTERIFPEDTLGDDDQDDFFPDYDDRDESEDSDSPEGESEDQILEVVCTIRLRYNIGNAAKAQALVHVADLLDYVAHHASSNGLFSGDTDYTVESWGCHVDTEES